MSFALSLTTHVPLSGTHQAPQLRRSVVRTRQPVKSQRPAPGARLRPRSLSPAARPIGRYVLYLASERDADGTTRARIGKRSFPSAAAVQHDGKKRFCETKPFDRKLTVTPGSQETYVRRLGQGVGRGVGRVPRGVGRVFRPDILAYRRACRDRGGGAPLQVASAISAISAVHAWLFGRPAKSVFAKRSHLTEKRP